MSEYKIKPYDESYIEKQVEIGSYFAQKWVAYNQSSVEQVKEVYSRDTFDPETRLYCFKGDELIGYIGANIVDVEEEEEKIKRAQTRLAFVLPGHEEAFSLLFNQLLEVLKRKQVDEIETPQTILNDNYYELSTNLGFTKTRTVTSILFGSTDSINVLQPEHPIVDYNHETDKEQVKQQLNATYPNFEGENLENYVNRMAENENLICYRVIKDNDKILAYCGAVSLQTPGVAQISLLIGENSELKKQLITDAMLKCKEQNYEKVAVYLNPDTPVEAEEIKAFKSVGFEIVGTYDILTKKL